MGLGNIDERLLQFDISDFSPGLFNSLTDINIPIGGGDIAENARFDDVKGIKVRKNRAKYNTSSLGANPIYGLSRIYIGSNSYTLGVYTTILKLGDDDAGTFSNLKTGLTADLDYTQVTYKNFHYLFNGTDSNIKTDGTAANTDVQGCTAPSANPTGEKDDTGSNLDEDTYQYKFAWVYDSYQISSVYGTPLSVATDSSNLSIDLYDFEATPANATHMNIYRTEGGGTTFYYHSQHTVAEIEGYLTGARYNDDIADSGLDTAILAPSDNGTPPVAKFGILHKDRIFLAGNSTYKSRVYYSDISSLVSYPDVYPANNYIDIAPDDGDEIMGLAIDPTGSLCVFKKNTVRKIFTDGDPVNWSVSEPYDFHGAISSQSITQTPHGIIYFARKGENGRELRKFTGTTASPISEKVTAEFNNVLRSRVDKTVGHYHEGLMLLSYTSDSAGQAYNDRVLLFDFNKDNFSIDLKNINCFTSWNGGSDRGELYTGDSNVGTVYREDTEIYDILHDTLTEFDTGAFSQVETTGTEALPELHLVDADLDNDIGATIVSSATVDTVADYDSITDHQTVSPSGTYISDHIEIDATNLDKIYWNETLGANGKVRFWIRVGASKAACTSDAWNGPYATAAGSDISGVSASKYIQYMAVLYSTDKDVIATPKISVSNGFGVKIDANLGTTAESAIPFNFRTGQVDCKYPRIIKVFKGIRLEYSSSSTGTLTFNYSIDRGSESSFSINLATYPTKYTANFPAGSLGELIRLRAYMNNTSDLTIKRIVLLYSLKPYRFS